MMPITITQLRSLAMNLLAANLTSPPRNVRARPPSLLRAPSGREPSRDRRHVHPGPDSAQQTCRLAPSDGADCRQVTAKLNDKPVTNDL
jgi:hypothetical protein